MTTYNTNKVLLNDKPVYFEACVNMMDDDLREELHEEVGGTGITDQEFLDIYCERHIAMFDEEFII